MSFVSELRRRQVFRTAAWYGGLAWLAVEVADTVFPRFGLPDWWVRAVIVGAALGLPLGTRARLAVRPERARYTRETGVVPAPSDRAGFPSARSAVPLWRIPSFWIALAIAVGLTVSAQQAWQRLIRPAFGERPGLAVLPFANLSPDPANAYFADGLHEEILATFARAGGLRVISRTSVQEYRDPKRNLREIADALGVSLILEGSVRREGDDLRLTLQLIDGRTDEHLWAETYDRKFRDALQLQRAVAEQVVAAIGATLTPTEQRLIAASAPSNPEAYEFYLHALTRWNQFASEPELRLLIGLLDRTIDLDPGFALAYALRAKARVWLASTYEDNEATIADVARSDIERALALESELPEALAARGLYSTYMARDAAAGLEDLMRSIALAPNDPDTHNAAGLTLRRLGRFDAALEQFRAAMELAPKEPSFGFRTHETLVNLGRIDEAREVSQALQRRFPDLPYTYFHPYGYRCLQGGDLTGWREEIERWAPQLSPDDLADRRRRFLICTGDLAGLAALLEQAPADSEIAQDRDLELGVVYMALGKSRRAQPHLASVAADAVRTRDDAWAQIHGAVALELLGQRAAALAAADEAARLSDSKLRRGERTADCRRAGLGADLLGLASAGRLCGARALAGRIHAATWQSGEGAAVAHPARRRARAADLRRSDGETGSPRNSAQHGYAAGAGRRSPTVNCEIAEKMFGDNEDVARADALGRQVCARRRRRAGDDGGATIATSTKTSPQSATNPNSRPSSPTSSATWRSSAPGLPRVRRMRRLSCRPPPTS